MWFEAGFAGGVVVVTATRACSSCGAGYSGDAISSKWTCAYCGRDNFFEAAVAASLKEGTGRRAQNAIDLGKMELESGDFAKAAAHFEEAVRDSATPDAWSWLAFATALGSRPENYLLSVQKVSRCLDRAAAGADSKLLAMHQSRATQELVRRASEIAAARIVTARRTLPRPDITAPAVLGAFQWHVTDGLECIKAAIQLPRISLDDRHALAAHAETLARIGTPILQGLEPTLGWAREMQFRCHKESGGRLPAPAPLATGGLNWLTSSVGTSFTLFFVGAIVLLLFVIVVASAAR
jgi:hypothetical protein